ncbi:hypothetical protein NPIL_204411 [Nephila pilipes]|uniref:Uncharacterized protein n=1 Tax=Nephila pilipes TaxID=299642 RepID=A0A8X6PAJ2_NEPPI|nr:hypothetical protein NPIL_204411 [Nephila pilipes]
MQEKTSSLCQFSPNSTTSPLGGRNRPTVVTTRWSSTKGIRPTLPNNSISSLILFLSGESHLGKEGIRYTPDVPSLVRKLIGQALPLFGSCVWGLRGVNFTFVLVRCLRILDQKLFFLSNTPV